MVHISGCEKTRFLGCAVLRSRSNLNRNVNLGCEKGFWENRVCSPIGILRSKYAESDYSKRGRKRKFATGNIQAATKKARYFQTRRIWEPDICTHPHSGDCVELGKRFDQLLGWSQSKDSSTTIKIDIPCSNSMWTEKMDIYDSQARFRGWHLKQLACYHYALFICPPVHPCVSVFLVVCLQWCCPGLYQSAYGRPEGTVGQRGELSVSSAGCHWSHPGDSQGSSLLHKVGCCSIRMWGHQRTGRTRTWRTLTMLMYSSMSVEIV